MTGPGVMVAARAETGTQSRTQWYLPVLATGMAALVVAAVVGVFLRGNAHDQSWYLLLGERLLAGEKPYGPTMVETNPPLIIWFSVLPVLLGKMLHVEAYTGLRLMVLAMIGGSAVWSARLVRRGEALAQAQFPVTWFAALFAGTLALMELSMRASLFAQREHLFDILVTPYVVGVLTGAVKRCSPAERCALGFAAGLGVCFKPQEVFVLVALELGMLAVQREWRRLVSPEVLTAAAAGVAYLAVVRWMTPLYQKDMLPLILDTYWAYGIFHTGTLLRMLKPNYVPGLVLAGSAVALRRWVPGALVVVGMVVCSYAAMLAYAVQHTNWDYHLMPAEHFLKAAVAWLALAGGLRLVEEWAAVPARKWAAVALVVAGLCGFALSLRGYRREPMRDFVRTENELLAAYPEGTPVYVFSTDLGYLTGIYARHLRWASRFPSLWMLPALTAFDEAQAGDTSYLSRTAKQHLTEARANELEAMERRAAAEDLDRWKPELVLVEPCTLEHFCQAIEGRQVDVVEWFKKSPEFARAWSAYERRQDPVGWEVYVRRSEPGADGR